MLNLTGKIVFINPRSFTTKSNETVNVVDFDIKDDNERYPITVTLEPDVAKKFKLNDVVNIPVRYYVGKKKDGGYFVTFRNI